MDRLYRVQRRFYDATRAFVLRGRDEAVGRIAARLSDGARAGEGRGVLEVGCGTARNLVRLARACPGARLFGLDVSRAMLDTAAAHVRRRGLQGRIALAPGLAEDLDRGGAFASASAFDAVLFSYSLSLMEGPSRAVEAALSRLAPGGTLHVVDFWTARGVPPPARRLLARWLSLFGVRPPVEAVAAMREAARAAGGRFRFLPVAGGYAFLAELARRPLPGRRPPPAHRAASAKGWPPGARPGRGPDGGFHSAGQ
jgi:S-adenosylmethionine-diacylgycerolhomoserine-N-methlytransferase